MGKEKGVHQSGQARKNYPSQYGQQDSSKGSGLQPSAPQGGHSYGYSYGSGACFSCGQLSHKVVGYPWKKSSGLRRGVERLEHIVGDVGRSHRAYVAFGDHHIDPQGLGHRARKGPMGPE